MTFSVAFLITISIPFVSPQSEKRIPLHQDMKLMKQEIMKLIPIGSHITDAKKLMEENGFKCKLKENEAFVEYDEQVGQILHEQEDFLWCDTSKQISEVIKRRWQVIITHKNGIVFDVYVSTGIIAP